MWWWWWLWCVGADAGKVGVAVRSAFERDAKNRVTNFLIRSLEVVVGNGVWKSFKEFKGRMCGVCTCWWSFVVRGGRL